MDRLDEEKTSFITEDGTYCYRAMPFGLKNAGATYQRLMNKIFRGQIGRNVEVYIDDMMVKSQTFQQHVADLKEVFGVLMQYRMRLNPDKCAFFIRGKFLGYMVNGKGIEPNLEKVEAILKMPEPTYIRDVQRLTGRVVALNRFMSKSAESSPLTGEELLIYLPASEQAVNAVLVREEGGEQKPIFYVSKVLKDAEVRAGRAQRKTHRSNGGKERTTALVRIQLEAICDGASSTAGSGAGVMLKGPEGFKVCYALRLEFGASNNIAEYEALINEMLIAMEIGATDLKINSDSQLVVNQITGAYQARDPIMQKYLTKVKAIKAELSEQRVTVKYQKIPREENEEVDLLSRLSEEELEQLPNEVYIQHINTPAFDKTNAIMPVEEGQSWMTPYLEYLEKGKLPEDKAKPKKIATRAPNYQAIRGTLYRRGKSSPWLRCVGPEEATRVMEEIHQGICGAHEGAGTLANKIFKQGYYWPLVKKETEEFKKFVIVAVEYFSKWPEAEAVPTITARKIIDFIWRNIIYRFGIPRVLISDNGKQFDCKTFKEFTKNMDIWHKFSSVAHPQTNSQTEVTNRAILQGLKKRLDGANKNWADELNSILWAFRATPRAPTKETPFALAFDTEAVVPSSYKFPLTEFNLITETLTMIS
ncbi:uncharacterized protein LOC110599777 [Manihot esculenta]|uniref:uncharacterized protein LOC110599777 n=1 Tax=Manihot esculenta TaxID=3983 RepID=UPI000B5D2D01|nr:uncharacterized protein LOC110599777 [Manihot esculenta]